MNKSKATIEVKGKDLVFTYGRNKMTLSEGELKRLISPSTTKESFCEIADAMARDFLSMEGYDWDIDSKELHRSLTIIYDSIILKYNIKFN